LPISFELNEISNAEVKKNIEEVIRECIGSRPQAETWKIWIYDLAGCYRVVLKAPVQARERMFFEDANMLAQEIRGWLDLYPLR
jgi:hypothetical protein